MLFNGKKFKSIACLILKISNRQSFSIPSKHFYNPLGHILKIIPSYSKLTRNQVPQGLSKGLFKNCITPRQGVGVSHGLRNRCEVGGGQLKMVDVRIENEKNQNMAWMHKKFNIDFIILCQFFFWLWSCGQGGGEGVNHNRTCPDRGRGERSGQSW